MSAYAGPADWWTDGTNLGRTHIATKGIAQSGLVTNIDAGVSTSYSGSGTTWTDLTGRGNNGTLTNGPTFSSTNGGSIVFDGSNDYVSLASPDLPTGTGDFTVSMWIKPTNFTANISKALLYGGVSGSFYLGIGRTYNGDINGLRIGRAFSADCENCAFTFTNAWHNVIVIRSSATIIFYVNNSQRTTVNGEFVQAANHSFVASNPANIGGSGEPFTGNISALHIYNRALSAAEVSQNFNALRGRYGI